MAYEHLLKIIVDGFESAVSDFVNLAILLNPRAESLGSKDFSPTPYVPPRPPYPSKEESAGQAALSAGTIADTYSLALKKLGGIPVSVDPLDPETYGQEGLLALVAAWQVVRAGVLKSILAAYGHPSGGQLTMTLPGPASEERLWAEAAAWLKKTAADASLFSIIQKLDQRRKSSVGSKGAPALINSLVSLEQSFHGATVDALSAAAALPYHLYRYQRAQSMRARTRSSRSGSD